MTCGYDAASNRAVCDLAPRFPPLAHALGLHPWYVAEPVEPILALIEQQRPTAVGEAGLDFWDDPSAGLRARQQEVLEAQLELAARLSLPVTLHARKALPELMATLKAHPGVRGSLHAFSGSYEQARPFVDLGYMIGIGGTVTRARARRVRECVRRLPLDCLLLETDAPAIGLDTVDPPHVRPHHLVRVVECVAELRGISEKEVETATDANALGLFALPPLDPARQDCPPLRGPAR